LGDNQQGELILLDYYDMIIHFQLNRLFQANRLPDHTKKQNNLIKSSFFFIYLQVVLMSIPNQ
jgi:hypothetical protein